VTSGDLASQEPVECCLWNQYALPDFDRREVPTLGRLISLVSADAEKPASFFDIVSLPII
jgi:hypothetical protein